VSWLLFSNQVVCDYKLLFPRKSRLSTIDYGRWTIAKEIPIIDRRPWTIAADSTAVGLSRSQIADYGAGQEE